MRQVLKLQNLQSQQMMQTLPRQKLAPLNATCVRTTFRKLSFWTSIIPSHIKSLSHTHALCARELLWGWLNWLDISKIWSCTSASPARNVYRNRNGRTVTKYTLRVQHCAFVKTCGQSFRFLVYLVLHQRKLRDERPTVCLHCGKQSSSRDCLKARVVRHTDGFPCTACGKKFYRDYNWNGICINTRGKNHTSVTPEGKVSRLQLSSSFTWVDTQGKGRSSVKTVVFVTRGNHI